MAKGRSELRSQPARLRRPQVPVAPWPPIGPACGPRQRSPRTASVPNTSAADAIVGGCGVLDEALSR